MPTLPADFGCVRSASITILVDNYADLLLDSCATVKRFKEKALLAEHGFAALVDLNDGETRILWDTGNSKMALLENLKNLKIDPNSVDKIALSHGHGDHTGAVAEFLRRLDLRAHPKEWPAGSPLEAMRSAGAERRIPLVVHPAVQREGWGLKEDGSRVGPFHPLPLKEWEGLGAEIILSEGPHQLASGCWTTGYVPRLSFERSGRAPERMQYRQGDQFLPDDIEDDQAIVIHVQGKGLVVLSGCAHAGIVNTVNYARQISGVEQVWGILGGFHTAVAKPDERFQTIDAIEQLRPELIVPTHCSGMLAATEFARRMPHAFVQGAVGTTFLF